MPAPQPVVARILHAFDVPFSLVHPPQKGYRNSSFCVETKQAKLNVILYKSEAGMAERIKRANAMGDFLAGRGVPARRTFSPKILQLKGQRSVRFAAIYHYLPGNTIPWEAYTMKHIKALGEAMGIMHAKLRGFGSELPEIANELIALNKRISRYFADRHVAPALQQKLGLHLVQSDFAAYLARTKTLPQQAVHMDFVRGNILFDPDARITGILDFEKCGRGAAVLDVARTLAFLLVDCKYKTESKIRKYFLQSGYIKRGGGIIANSELMEQLVTFFLLHDFYKFLRHNPYESLPQNEHFMRTRAILLQRGQLSVK